MRKLVATGLVAFVAVLVLSVYTVAAATLVVNAGVLQAWTYTCEYDDNVTPPLNCDEQ